MNTRTLRFMPVLIIAASLLSACSSAATPPTQRPPIGGYPAPPSVPVTGRPAATSVPAYQSPGAPASVPVSGQGRAPESSNQAGRVPIPPTSVPPSRPAEVPALPPSSEGFRDAGVNPWIDATRDHLSTFAIDTDTASYDVARRYLQNGQLPPYAAVRVEEFVNAFKPGYALPRNLAFGLYADAAPSPFHGQDTVLVRFGVQGAIPEPAARRSVSYVFVVDVSGSMSTNNRLGLAVDALKMLASRMRSDDTIGIVAFTTTARNVLAPTPVSNLRAINSALDSLRTEASTNVGQGLEFGYRMANQAFRQDGNNRVFLISDGVANEGGITPEAILRQVSEYASKGIQLHTIGVGFGDYNDALLEQLADKGNGQYVYINTTGDAEKLVAEKFASYETIALDAKTQVDFNADVVVSYRQIGYENRAVADSDFRNNSAGGGGIGAGRCAVALYAVQLRPGAQGRIATLQLRWQDPRTREWQEINGNLTTFDVARSYEQAAPRFRLAATVAQFAEILRQSPHASQWPMWDIAKRADALKGELRDDNDVAVFAEIANAASRAR